MEDARNYGPLKNLAGVVRKIDLDVGRYLPRGGEKLVGEHEFEPGEFGGLQCVLDNRPVDLQKGRMALLGGVHETAVEPHQQPACRGARSSEPWRKAGDPRVLVGEWDLGQDELSRV